ncbi:MarR family winged helix-turn-helix transcriptional regulator [Fodinicola acaciae]|uniref:MarR family winged helix-turn-helix transcriptional regulator n=1 Tax=Fodinicola acaciae TaxID=2681555 RepID=UPI0013CF4A8A|nr:MarR family transcriptional regulator [Fodinicola acaciae]
MAEQDSLIDRIEQADDEFVRVAAATVNSPLQSVDLTMQQLKVLMIVAVGGPASGQQLAAALGIGLAGVSGVVHRLSARGYVRRAVDPNDRRIRRVHLTPKATRLIDEMRDAGRENKRRLLRKMDDDALRKMAEAMEALIEAAREDS